MPVTYFSLWITRLLGWMPSLTHCTSAGSRLAADPRGFSRNPTASSARLDKKPASRNLSAESLAVARRIFQSPLAALASGSWPPARAADLRRFTVQSLERHLERRLHSAAALAKLAG